MVADAAFEYVNQAGYDVSGRVVCDGNDTKGYDRKEIAGEQQRFYAFAYVLAKGELCAQGFREAGQEEKERHMEGENKTVGVSCTVTKMPKINAENTDEFCHIQIFDSAVHFINLRKRTIHAISAARKCGFVRVIL